MHLRQFTSLLALPLVLAILQGCSQPTSEEDHETNASTTPRSETVTSGPVTITLTLTPGAVMLDRDVVLSLRATAPPHISVKLPPIDDRLQGFLNAGQFDREPVSTDATVTIERVARLTPLIADEYRVAPMAITFDDTQSDVALDAPASTNWLATPPIVLPLSTVTDAKVGQSIASQLKPRWIHPSMRHIAEYAVGLMLALVALFFIWKVIRRFRRRIRLMRMSPRERALEELDELLAKRLIEKHQIKDFYVELTMVVRRYIERQHHIRAPEQTTEEFLAAAGSDPRFDSEVVARLSTFLASADLVKFAAYQPDDRNITTAVDGARDYITTDADKIEANEGVVTVTEHKEELL